jgi:hypothetical protein
MRSGKTAGQQRTSPIWNRRTELVTGPDGRIARSRRNWSQLFGHHPTRPHPVCSSCHLFLPRLDANATCRNHPASVPASGERHPARCWMRRPGPPPVTTSTSRPTKLRRSPHPATRSSLACAPRSRPTPWPPMSPPPGGSIYSTAAPTSAPTRAHLPGEWALPPCAPARITSSPTACSHRCCMRTPATTSSAQATAYSHAPPTPSRGYSSPAPTTGGHQPKLQADSRGLRRLARRCSLRLWRARVPRSGVVGRSL